MKKTMRKSALLSSVAMLIVSAIVLTSATYAWFSASTQANVTGIEATVETSTGILISTDGSSWKTNINFAGFTPDNFAPCSTADGATFVTGGYQNDQLELKPATAGTELVWQDLYVKGTAGEDVTVAPVFTCDANIAKAVKFALYDMSANKFLGGGVVAADGSTGTYSGTSYNGNMAANDDDAFTATANTSTVTEITASALSFELTGSAQRFKLCVWVEGNDADCVMDKVTGESVGFTVSFSIPEQAAA